MHPNLIASRFLEIIDPDPSRDLQDVMGVLGAEFGFGHFTYFANPRPNARYDENIILTSYPEAWQGRYREKDYHMIDPVVSHGMRSLLPLDWSLLPRNSAAVRQFFGEAGDLGVHPNGITIPIRDANRGCGLFSVNIEISERDWLSYKRAFISELTYLSFLFHDRAMRVGMVPGATERPALSPREVEVLQWAGNGKTRWETSVILGISESAVKLYLANACAKLRVANTTHAVARCVTEGLFDVR
ncbi:LuxR family transcriptional regulator [Defluviimonas sp. CAU 1641]|uniref:LuxR family transcriptional regulator n=2 Tax=Defluviimonas salinarum TaxID=2992147 RepID=A0ABT3JBF3_9RHOB|nr:LuxR family transcriptional regulator [Defluviimonas salinarum]